MHQHAGDAYSIFTQTALGAILPPAMEYLKKRDWMPFLTERSDLLNRSVSFVVALATTAGFTADWQGTIDAGGVLQISVPPFEALVRVLWQVGVHEGVYRKFVKKRTEERVPAPLQFETQEDRKEE